MIVVLFPELSRFLEFCPSASRLLVLNHRYPPGRQLRREVP